MPSSIPGLRVVDISAAWILLFHSLIVQYVSFRHSLIHGEIKVLPLFAR
jgi:hypothetical protein